jgi:hypothetical protein
MISKINLDSLGVQGSGFAIQQGINRQRCLIA